MRSSRLLLVGALGCCLGIGIGLLTAWAVRRGNNLDSSPPAAAQAKSGRSHSSVLMEFDASRFFEHLAGAPVPKDQIESGSLVIGEQGYPDSAWAIAVWAGDPAAEPVLAARLREAVRSSLRGGVKSTATTAGNRDVTWEPLVVVQKATGQRQLYLAHTYYFEVGTTDHRWGQIHAWLTVSGDGKQYSGSVRVTE